MGNSVQEQDPKYMEIKGVSISLEEIDIIQRGCRLTVEQYGGAYSTWEQALAAVLLYQRVETLKQYAKPV